MLTIQQHAQDYYIRLQRMLEAIDLAAVARVADIFYSTWRDGRTVYIIGNGGSAATASHMACDLNKGTSTLGLTRLRIVSLTDNVAWMTAIGNDLAYDRIFTDPLENLFRPEDVLLAISASGNSPNVVKAVEWANMHGGKTIAFCGFKGGRIHELAHESVHFPSHDYGPVEDGHLILNHILVEHLLARFQAS